MTDFVDHSWEIFRLRRLRDALIKGNMWAGLAELLNLTQTRKRHVSSRWVSRLATARL